MTRIEERRGRGGGDVRGEGGAGLSFSDSGEVRTD